MLYADDTLLIGYEEEGLQDLLEAVSWAGSQYGMSLHWSKFQLLGVRAEYRLTTPDGQGIPPKDVMSYLGANVHGDGALARELAQKLGILEIEPAVEAHNLNSSQEDTHIPCCGCK